MTYIGKSPIGIHGRLTSKNCLVDSRFQIKSGILDLILSPTKADTVTFTVVDPKRKISDFETILTDKFHRRESKDNETFLEQLLWMDPEIVKASGKELYKTSIATSFYHFRFWIYTGFGKDKLSNI